MKSKKGVAGLPIFLSVISVLFIIGLITMVFVIAGSKLQTTIGETSSITSLSGAETGINVTTAGYTLSDCNSSSGKSDITAVTSAYLANYPSSGLRSFTNTFPSGLNTSYHNATTVATIQTLNGRISINGSADNSTSGANIATNQTIYADSFGAGISIYIENQNVTGTNIVISGIGIGNTTDGANYGFCGIGYNSTHGMLITQNSSGGNSVKLINLTPWVEPSNVNLGLSYSNSTKYLTCSYATYTDSIYLGGLNNTGSGGYLVMEGKIVQKGPGSPTGTYNTTITDLSFSQTKAINSSYYNFTDKCDLYAVGTEFNQSLWDVAYTYSVEQTGTGDTEAIKVINDTKTSLGGVTDWFDIFIVLTALVVLVLLVVIIINSIRGTGMIGGEGGA